MKFITESKDGKSITVEKEKSSKKCTLKANFICDLRYIKFRMALESNFDVTEVQYDHDAQTTVIKFDCPKIYAPKFTELVIDLFVNNIEEHD